jgi:retron-type reverse transcriptase
MRTAQTVLTVIQERGKQHKPIERVYKLLFNRDFYLNAYAKLYPNNGAMTKGVTDETVDGMSIQKIDRMIELLREEKYQWKPARREYIPKKNGKKRPLGIPTWGDKLLQEVMREILEAYYEPQFSNHSHGFRPNRGCHTALQEIQIWKGTRWFIEGDISKYFDTIDHDVLLKILEKNIHDGRFLRLISNMLKAGYLDDWKFNQTISGTPQGGVISPLLANIYLNEFDQWIENTLIPQYTKGKRQKGKDIFSMQLMEKTYTEKEPAGKALLGLLGVALDTEKPVPIGNYKGLALQVSHAVFGNVFSVKLVGAGTYTAELGNDVLGNLTRISNLANGIEPNIEKIKAKQARLEQQLASAEEEVKRPFPQAAELAEKSNRLAVLDGLLNMNDKDIVTDTEPEQQCQAANRQRGQEER